MVAGKYFIHFGSLASQPKLLLQILFLISLILFRIDEPEGHSAPFMWYFQLSLVDFTMVNFPQFQTNLISVLLSVCREWRNILREQQMNGRTFCLSVVPARYWVPTAIVRGGIPAVKFCGRLGDQSGPEPREKEPRDVQTVKSTTRCVRSSVLVYPMRLNCFRTRSGFLYYVLFDLSWIYWCLPLWELLVLMSISSNRMYWKVTEASFRIFLYVFHPLILKVTDHKITNVSVSFIHFSRVSGRLFWIVNVNVL